MSNGRLQVLVVSNRMGVIASYLICCFNYVLNMMRGANRWTDANYIHKDDRSLFGCTATVRHHTLCGFDQHPDSLDKLPQSSMCGSG